MNLLLYFFFFLMLVLPTTFQVPRGGLLVLLVLVGSVAALRRWRVAPDILLFWALTLVAGIFYMFWGYMNNAPGALRVGTVYVLWPVVYMLLVGLATPRLIHFLNRTLLWGIAISGGMALALLVGALLGNGSGVADLLSFQGAAIGIYGGYVELTLFNLTTVIYGLPFLVSALFVRYEQNWLKSRAWGWFLLGLVFLICLVSGRRGFWLLSLAVPLIVWVLAFLSGYRLHWRSVGLGAVILGSLGLFSIWAADISVMVLVDQFRSAFSGHSRSSDLRLQQWAAMWDSFSKSPLIGQGLGAALDPMRENKKMAWAYELYYGALLFKVGLLGLAIYGVAVFWVFFSGIKLARRMPEAGPVILPLLAGLAGFLLINATNPYLTKFDYLWTIFLPVAAINAYRQKMPPATSSSSTGTPDPNYANA